MKKNKIIMLVLFTILIMSILGCEKDINLENREIEKGKFHIMINESPPKIIVENETIKEIKEIEEVINITITKANDTRVLVIVEGNYIPSELEIICIHEVTNNANITYTTYTKQIIIEDELYAVEFNRDICRAGDLIQVCPIKNNVTLNNSCSNIVEISLAPFKMKYYKYGGGGGSSNSQNNNYVKPLIGVPEYNLWTGLILIIIVTLGLIYLRKRKYSGDSGPEPTKKLEIYKIYYYKVYYNSCGNILYKNYFSSKKLAQKYIEKTKKKNRMSKTDKNWFIDMIKVNQ